MRKFAFPVCAFLSILSMFIVSAETCATSDLQAQVANTERAFADTMAKRDHAKFASN